MARRKLVVITVASMLAACDGLADRQDSDGNVDDDPDIRGWLAGMNSIPASPPSTPAAAPVDALIGGLRQRLEANPDDLKGWRLLALSYAFVGDMQAARSAMQSAIGLGADARELEAAVLGAHTGRRR